MSSRTRFFGRNFACTRLPSRCIFFYFSLKDSFIFHLRNRPLILELHGRKNKEAAPLTELQKTQTSESKGKKSVGARQSATCRNDFHKARARLWSGRAWKSSFPGRILRILAKRYSSCVSIKRSSRRAELQGSSYFFFKGKKDSVISGLFAKFISRYAQNEDRYLQMGSLVEDTKCVLKKKKKLKRYPANV